MSSVADAGTTVVDGNAQGYISRRPSLRFIAAIPLTDTGKTICLKGEIKGGTLITQ